MTIEIKAMLWTMLVIVVFAVSIILTILTDGWFIIGVLAVLAAIVLYLCVYVILKEIDNA